VLSKVEQYDRDGMIVGWRWQETYKGPQIDRKADRMFMCVGLELINMGGDLPDIVSFAIRGRSSGASNLTIEFHSYKEISEAYRFRNRVYNSPLPAHMAPNLFTIDAF
jgi:hypothetical protein